MLDLARNQFLQFERRPGEPARIGPATEISGDTGSLKANLDPYVFAEMVEGIEMARSLLPEFDPEAFRAGNMTPVVFGSALRYFGVAELLQTLHSYAPAPRAQKAVKKGAEIMISRDDPSVSGFVFKIQANMDPNHRDRVAFLRLCSGSSGAACA